MLLRADDKLVPKFLQALSETNQKHVADILVDKGSNTFVVLFCRQAVMFCSVFFPVFFLFKAQIPVSQTAERRLVKCIPEVQLHAVFRFFSFSALTLFGHLTWKNLFPI